MRSTSSPKNSMRSTLSDQLEGNTSNTSPFARKVPRTKSYSLRWYCISTSRRITSSRSISMPLRRDMESLRYSAGSPRAYIQLTEATIITSLRSFRAQVALWRSLSISSFTVATFSIYVSDEAMYASGW